MDKAKQQREDFIQRMFSEIEQISIERIIGSVIELVPKGRHYMGLCPFHPDNHIGSFIVTPDIGLWHCFTEGIGGNGIAFYSRYYNINYLEAAFKIAFNFGIITQNEYTFYSRKKYDTKTIQAVKQSEKRNMPIHIANAEIVDKIYESIAAVCPLSKKHKEHLLRERHLQESDLTDYFSFPTKNMDLPGKVYLYLCKMESKDLYGTTILNKLTKVELSTIEKHLDYIKKEFPYVPGFYYDEKRKKIDFASYKGIGILVRNDQKRIIGIQIRRDTVKSGERRYVWFSSSFAIRKPDMHGGASSSAPGGVIFPKKDNSINALCITEGRFKAEKIAATGNTAVYLSGVSTWKSILPMISRIRGQRKRLLLIFDADVLGNVAVHSQLYALGSELKTLGFHVWILTWPKERGKGFDDLVNNTGFSYVSYLKQFQFFEFEKIYQNTLKITLNSFGVKTIRDITHEQAEQFNSSLQNAVEKNLGIS